MTVLLVEDNVQLVDLITYSVTEATIYAVGTLAAAKEFLAQNRVDMILLDLGLPDSKGLETLKAFEGIRTPKVVISGSFLAREAIGTQIWDYILKDSYADLIERVKFNLERVAKMGQKRVRPEVFEEIKAHICFRGGELVAV